MKMPQIHLKTLRQGTVLCLDKGDKGTVLCLGIIDSSSDYAAMYTYDAWGNLISSDGGMSDDFIEINPLRYRGYVYDQETGLYYLQSRYYNPEIGRFINADNYISTGQGFLGRNMFAYCLNNPVCYRDDGGTMADSYGGMVGEDIAEVLYELITGRKHPSHQAEQIEIEVTQKQIEIVRYIAESVEDAIAAKRARYAMAAKYVGHAMTALWDAYMRGYNIQQESQRMNSMALIEGVSFYVKHPKEALGAGIAVYDATKLGYTAGIAFVTAIPFKVTVGAVVVAAGTAFVVGFGLVCAIESIINNA